MATRESFQPLSFQFQISLNAVAYIVKGCCKAIVVSRNFEQRRNYPRSLGAIDGKLVTIRKPKNVETYYYNYKHTHSIILLPIAGEYIYADVGWNGRVVESVEILDFTIKVSYMHVSKKRL